MKLKIITLFAVLAVGAASLLTLIPQGSDNTQQLLFPELSLEKLGEISNIKITAKGETIEISRDGKKQWQIAQARNYPANPFKVREVLSVFLANKLEEKTTDADYYTYLGVEDYDGTDAQSVLVEIDDSENTWRLLLGLPAKQMKDGQYARIPDTESSWLIDRQAIIQTAQADWWQTEILHLPQDDIREIVATDLATDKVLNISRATMGEELIVTNDGIEADKVPAFRIKQVAAVTDYMKFKDLILSPDKELNEHLATIIYTSFQGLKISVDTYKHDTSTFFTVHTDHEENADQAVRRLVESINAVNKDRVYAALDTMHLALGTSLQEIFALL